MKRIPTWAIFLIFPLIGLVGFIAILASGSGSDDNTPEASFPTPPPIETTPVPTPIQVTVIDSPAPDSEILDAAGEAFTLQDYSGQIVVVNFWATWCPPCVEEMPTLQTYAQENEDVIILAVTDPNDAQTMDEIEAFISEYNLTNIHFGFDDERVLPSAMGVMNLPMTFVVDRDGIVRFRQIGEVTADDLDFYISELS